LTVPELFLSRLFHFSEESDIQVFLPRAVRVPSQRPVGMEWLNGPLVWAIDAAHSFLYLFPRECPRLLAWATEESSLEDRAHWLGGARAVAYVESAWESRLSTTVLTRYELSPEGFEDLDDAGMWVSRGPARILERVALTDLRAQIERAGVELRVVASLSPLMALRDTSLHVSAIRMRNAGQEPAP
jgi:hypothetical protein